MSSQLKLSAYGALATMTAAVSLLSVFSSTVWIMPVMVAVAVVAATCALVRASPLPSALEPVLAALGVLIWVTVLDARSQAHAGFIPGRLAFRHLATIARHGFTEIHRVPTPAPAHHGLVLLTIIGVSAIALVVDLLTVTLRRAALAGLPLLALFTVGAATGHNGVGVVAFVIAAIGYLCLLYADNRDKVARWGAAVGSGRARPASAWSTDPSSAPAPAALGRQVGAVAIGLGILVPVLIPGLHTGIAKNHSGAGTGPGAGTSGGHVQTFNPIVRIGADLASSAASPVLTYRSSAPNPGYLRLTSLGQFDGSSFTSGSLTAPASAGASENLPVTPPQGSPPSTTTITMSSDAAYRWLPVPSTALGVSVGDAWRYDPGTATIFSATTDTQSLHYTVRSAPNQPPGAQLAVAGKPTGAALAGYTTVPSGIIPRAVRRLTQSITAGARTDYQAALDIQRYFTTGSRFTYDTTIPSDNSPNALAHFLLHTRRGFCQQFATAMAVMARLRGIPARVAVGFTRGKKQTDGSWLVTTHDAHAWPELWFQGFGWLPFEPTPRGDGQAVTPPYAKTAQGNVGGTQKSSQFPKTTGSAGPRKVAPDGQHQLPGVGGGPTGGARTGGSGTAATDYLRLAAWWLVLLCAVGLLVPGTARALVRRGRWRRMDDPEDAATVAWAELRDSAIDLGAPWDDERSPRQTASSLLSALEATPPTRDAMRRLVNCEERSRYAPTPDTSCTTLKQDVLAIRSAAIARCSRTQRTRALVLPRSTLLAARSAVSRLARRWEGWRRALPGVRTITHSRADVAVRP